MKIKLMDNPGHEDDPIRRGDAITTIAEKEHTYPSSLWFVPRMDSEMSAVEYLAAEQRMCFDDNVGKRNCLSCPLSSRINPAKINCGDYSRQHPEKAVATVEKWAKEHPEPKEETDADVMRMMTRGRSRS